MNRLSDVWGSRSSSRIPQSRGSPTAPYVWISLVSSITLRQLQERLATSRPTSTVVGWKNHERRIYVDRIFTLCCLNVTHGSTSSLNKFTLQESQERVKPFHHAGFRLWVLFGSSPREPRTHDLLGSTFIVPRITFAARGQIGFNADTRVLQNEPSEISFDTTRR